MREVRASPSRVVTYDMCPRQYHYKYELRWSPLKRSVNLAFGSAIDTALSAYLREETRDPATLFNVEFAQRAHDGLKWGKWDREKLTKTGLRLCELFVAGWEASNLVVLRDPQGEPVVQRQLRIDFGNGIVASPIIDLMALDLETLRVLTIDLKTATSQLFDGFSDLSDQLTEYNIAVDAHARLLGIQRTDGLGFIELLKRTVSTRKGSKGPEVVFHDPVPARSEEVRSDFIKRVQQYAENVRAARFGRRPLHAFNSPCSLCDFATHCRTGSTEGLITGPRSRANSMDAVAAAA